MYVLQIFDVYKPAEVSYIIVGERESMQIAIYRQPSPLTSFNSFNSTCLKSTALVYAFLS